MAVSKYLTTLFKKTYKDIFTQVDEVAQSVEVVMDGEQYRIEVLRAHDERQGCWARCWVLRDLTLQPTYSEAGQETPQPESMQVFVKNETFPWVNKSYPKDALCDALDFLARRKKDRRAGT